ncbi:MAG: hypothetical protein V3V14_09360 [Saprospiraceae bacterium]
MHDIEPYHKWREYYIAANDDKSPFYSIVYDEFSFSNKIYNYFIHPQWDSIGSPSLYVKVLYVDYGIKTAMIELLGEWNDAINNDIMILKRNVIDKLLSNDISKFILFGDNVLNYHGDEDSYYEEWYEDVSDAGGWICFVNFRHHVISEMETINLQYYLLMGNQFNDILWRHKTPNYTIEYINQLINQSTKQLRY